MKLSLTLTDGGQKKQRVNYFWKCGWLSAFLSAFCYAVEPHFYRVRYQSLTHAGNTPGTPCKAGCFFLYCVIRARLFRIRSAVCFRVIRFLQSGQYFAWLELDAKAAPHTVQRRISSAFNSSAYNSLSRGSTAVRNHLQSSE